MARGFYTGAFLGLAVSGLALGGLSLLTGPVNTQRPAPGVDGPAVSVPEAPGPAAPGRADDQEDAAVAGTPADPVPAAPAQAITPAGPADAADQAQHMDPQRNTGGLEEPVAATGESPDAPVQNGAEQRGTGAEPSSDPLAREAGDTMQPPSLQTGPDTPETPTDRGTSAPTVPAPAMPVQDIPVPTRPVPAGPDPDAGPNTEPAPVPHVEGLGGETGHALPGHALLETPETGSPGTSGVTGDGGAGSAPRAMTSTPDAGLEKAVETQPDRPAPEAAPRVSGENAGD